MWELKKNSLCCLRGFSGGTFMPEISIQSIVRSFQNKVTVFALAEVPFNFALHDRGKFSLQIPTNQMDSVSTAHFPVP
jgi:hypothetical protein